MTAPPLPPVTAAPVWTRPARLAASALLALALGLLGWHIWAAGGWGSRPTERETSAPAGRIDLNHADRAQLRQLPGVGDTTASRIEEYRLSHNGGFRSVEELRKVHGVGPALLARLRPLVEVTADEPAEDEPDTLPPPLRKEPPGRTPPPPVPRVAVGPKKLEALAAAVDVNRATAAELQRLPGIGPALSGRIIQVRDREPFRTVDELRRVPGIGPKTLERLRPFVKVE